MHGQAKAHTDSRRLAAWALAVTVMVCCAAALAERTILADNYLDRLRGMWLGQILGNYAGRDMEGYISRGGLYYTVDWNAILATPVWDGDDDTCFEYLNMNLLATNADPTSAQIGAMWTNHVEQPSFYIANRQARWLMSNGYLPPDTGSIQRNVHWYAIDSQITTESVGAAAVGMRQRAADLTGRFAGVSNQGFPVHAAQFYAAMYASAAFESNVETLVEKGLAVVPVSSRTYRVVQDVRDWYQQDKADGSLNWRATQAKIYDRYFGAESYGRFYTWVESAVNTGLTTMALLYGQGDFKSTVQIGVQGGFDSDCNPATAGGLLGLMQGYSGLPADLTAGATDDYLASSWLININRSSHVSAIAAGWQTAAEAQVLLGGGSITGTGATRTYHLPDADEVTPPPEKPDPPQARGLVGQVRSAGGTVTVSASVEKHDPSRDRDNLEGIADGVTDVTYNGHKPYTTYDGENPQPAGGDFYQLNFDRRLRFESLVFFEGDFALGGNVNSFPTDNPPKGGYFDDLAVEVASGGVFAPVSNLHFGEPLDAYKFYQQIALTFEPVGGEGIRIRGRAGGTSEFTTIVELEAYGHILGPPAAGDANYDGDVDFADYQALERSYGATSGATWAMGDFDADGDVDFSDYQALERNFGQVVPEPAALAVLSAGALAGLLRRRPARCSRRARKIAGHPGHPGRNRPAARRRPRPRQASGGFPSGRTGKARMTAIAAPTFQ